ncbi:MAG: hypothetical protein HQ504_12935 [Rhodospirillaceae bacterium]|nr:hypothetical protein [Rhodospirillaceae bacterium]
MDNSTISESPTHPFQIGNWWVDESGGFHSAYGIDSSIDTFLFRHLGQVKLIVKHSGISIHWDSRHVEEGALPAVLGRLCECKKNISVQLNFFYIGWAQENYSDPLKAIDRIFQVKNGRSIDILHTTMMAKHGIENIDKATPLINRGYKLWDRSGGCFDKISQDIYPNYLPHILIFRPDRREENLNYAYVGSKSTAARVAGRKWVANATSRVSDQSCAPEDDDFAEQVSAGFQGVLDTGEPRYEHVRALLHPEEGEPFWLSYERLLTRHMLHDGKPAVICLVNQTQDISIPLLGGP